MDDLKQQDPANDLMCWGEGDADEIRATRFDFFLHLILYPSYMDGWILELDGWIDR